MDHSWCTVLATKDILRKDSAHTFMGLCDNLSKCPCEPPLQAQRTAHQPSSWGSLSGESVTLQGPCSILPPNIHPVFFQQHPQVCTRLSICAWVTAKLMKHRLFSPSIRQTGRGAQVSCHIKGLFCSYLCSRLGRPDPQVRGEGQSQSQESF